MVTRQPHPEMILPPISPSEDFYLAEIVRDGDGDDDGDDGELTLRPEESPPRPFLHGAFTPVTSPFVYEPPQKTRLRDTIRFSLLELMAVFTFVAIGMSAATWLPIDVFAGVMGFLLLLGLVRFALKPPESRMEYLVWSVVTLLYLGSAATAVMRA